MSKYPKSEYGNTRNMSTRQQNEAKYLQSEYSHTQNTSIAGKLIRGAGRASEKDTAERALEDVSECGNRKRRCCCMPKIVRQ